MSIATEIARIQSSAATIRSKFVEIGISESTAKIDNLATDSEQIINQGAVTATVPEGETYTIPKGYHNGSGTVTGVAPTGTTEIETWETPDLTSNDGPAPYSAFTNDTTNPENVWKLFDGDPNTSWHGVGGNSYNPTWVGFDFGKEVTLTGIRFRPSNDAEHGRHATDAGHDYGVSVGLIGSNTKFASDQRPTSTVSSMVQGIKTEDDWYTAVVPFEEKFRYLYITANGANQGFNYLCFSEIEFKTKQTVGSYSLQDKVITPTTKQQNVTPDSGFYGLSSVTVNPIPSNYKDVSVVTAEPDDVLAGKTIVKSDGTIATGTMVNNGEITKTIDGLSITSVDIPAGYTSGGTVSLDDSIENALKEI